MSMEVPFSELDHSDLVIDCIYRGGTAKNLSAEPFHKLIRDVKTPAASEKS